MPKDVREVVITLRGSASADEEEASTSGSETAREEGGGESNITKAAFAKMIMQVASKAANEIIAWADYNIDKSFNLKDDYIGQRNMAVAEYYINGAANTISMTANGALAGFAVGGWVGAIIGGVIGLGTNIAGNVRSNIQGADRQNIMLKQMDLQLQYTRRRAGWSTHAASIGEDL